MPSGGGNCATAIEGINKEMKVNPMTHLTVSIAFSFQIGRPDSDLWRNSLVLRPGSPITSTRTFFSTQAFHNRELPIVTMSALTY